jgi:hypothetical protein
LASATKGSQAVSDFCSEKGPIEGLLPIDVAHNIGAVSNVVPGALKALRDDVDNTILNIFTKPKNCPTPNVSARLLSRPSIVDHLLH